jgi:predicted transposase YdaD
LARRKRKQATQQQRQPYDNVLKSLIEGHEREMVPVFLQEAEFLQVLNVEVLRPPLRVDRVYKVWYRDQEHILHLEFESGADSKMSYRLLSYHAYFLEQYELPVISIIVYPFPTSVAESPFQEMSGHEELLRFHFQVLRLWQLEAEHFVQEHIVSMYALLPSMRGANEHLLSQALDELVQQYKGHETQLAQQLKWLGVLLRRAEIMSVEDQQAIQERLDMWDNLLEEDPYIQKKVAKGVAEGEARGEAKGEARGEAKGEIRASQRMVIDLVDARFPSLVDLARQRVQKIKETEDLRQLGRQIAVAPDEATARRVLTSFAA